MISSTAHASDHSSSESNAERPVTWSKVVALVVLFCWYPLRYMHYVNIGDPDIWWHMSTGEWIMQHHAVPRVDVFSASAMGKPWVAYSWLFEVIIYGTARHLDLLGIVAYKVVMCVAIMAALLHLLRGLCSRFWPAWGLTLIGGMAMARVYTPRPGMFSTLLFIIVLDILLTARRTGSSRFLWWLPALFVLWANLHIQFVYGLLILAVYCLEPAMTLVFRRAPESKCPAVSMRVRVGVLCASTLATFVNPYGMRVYNVLWDYARQPKLAMLVSETRPMDFGFWLNWIVLALTVCAVVALIKSRKLGPMFFVLLIWAALSAFRAERDVWVLVTISCAVLSATIASVETGASSLTRKTSFMAVLSTTAVLLLGFTVVAPSNKQLLARISSVLPMGSVAYIHEHHPPGPIFNDFNWGGFLIYAVPELPVSIDGRTNIHNAKEIEQSWSTWSAEPGWEDDSNLEKANIVLGAPTMALTKRLEQDPHYRVVFNDGVSVLLLRNR